MQKKRIQMLSLMLGSMLMFGCGKDILTIDGKEIPGAEVLWEEEESLQELEEAVKELTVHVCGAVRKPGVYVLESGARLYEAIELAGGSLPQASETSLNLAQPVCDGMQIIVPTKEEAAEKEAEAKEAGKVNINTAGMQELMSLPGIGESRAAEIISYREQRGSFVTKEDLMKVTGIKEASYRKLEEYITVSG